MTHYSPDFDSDSDMDKLTSKIFSILENDFLFGHKFSGKVRILSIDAQGFTDGILAATSLSHLESSLQKMTSDPDTRIADHFDIVAASGSGGILASLLFSRGPDGRPLSTARDALQFLLTSRWKKSSLSSPSGLIGRMLMISMGSKNKAWKKKLGKMSLKDTLKAVLIPCYDLSTRAPFVFSRADAFESDAFDFKLTDVCSATTADDPGRRPFHMRSIDKKTTIHGVGCCLAADVSNPTAVAITHVLNNKQEFPMCRGLDDLLILSLGDGQLLSPSPAQVSPSPSVQGASSHLVDEAVSMAFAECRSTNYVRIQGNCSGFPKKSKQPEIINSVEDMLKQKNAQSAIFRGKKLVNYTNTELLEMFGTEVIKEHERRKMDTLPTVLLKQTYVPSSPRTSSATNLSTFSSN